MWERQKLGHEVAVYVRRLTEVEVPGAPTNLGTLVRQLGDDLGVTLPGMLRHHWRLGADDVAVRRRTRKASTDRFAEVTDAESA